MTMKAAVLEVLLSHSRDVAQARNEEELTGATARALEHLFGGCSFCIRLVDPKTLALTTLYARGRLKSQARERIALRRAAVRASGLSEAALEAGGLAVVERDEPVFEGCDQALAVPLTARGALFGLINLECGPEGEPVLPGGPAEQEPLLSQVANQAALAVRNLSAIEELTFLKTYLEDLIENANALIVVVNRELEVLVFNRALSRLTGHSREEALGEELLELVPEEERRRLARVMTRTLEGEPVSSFETRFAMRPAGQARIAFNTSPIYGSSGEVEGVIAIGHDLTGLRAAEERAEQAQKLAEFGKLAAGIVHELANPLTSIIAYSDNLIGKLSLSGREQAEVEKLRRIHESGQRILRFSRDLLAYARPSAARREPVDLAATLEQAAAMCEPALRDVSARLERRFEPVPPVWGVRSSLTQVFVNLITNAAHALAPADGVVTLELADSGDHVAARVRDNGAGMDPEVRGRIFEPFFSTKPDGQGAGLGLSIVQGIVQRHGGALSVESEAGAGSAFTVMLPKQPPG
ncbi:MAG TPA: ATP-binding protein [Anaeromyxobacteraceae bacterium]|jgi:PAS domain S-box-containing protein|nr:ATP-binding protein [Anaeromyxobacteraceae bacterium]